MALFRNQSNKSIDELESYYTGKQQRSGMAWVMAFFSLILTIAVLGGLFFGGRWAYREITEDDKQVATNTTQNQTNPSASGGVVSNEAARTESPSPAPSSPTPSPAPAPNPTPTPSPAPSPTPSSTPQTNGTTAGVSSNNTSRPLPNTGSNVSIVVVSALTATVVGYTIALRRQAQKQ